MSSAFQNNLGDQRKNDTFGRRLQLRSGRHRKADDAGFSGKDEKRYPPGHGFGKSNAEVFMG
jgi:hypothetical protein